MAKAHSQVWDSETTHKHEVLAAQQKHKQQVIEWCKNEEGDSQSLFTDDFALCGNLDHQLGRSMWHTEFEKRLKPLLPTSLTIIDGSLLSTLPHHADVRAIGFWQNGVWVSVCPYKRGLLPEKSQIKIEEKLVRDTAVWHLDRKDTPKAEWVPGKGFEFDPTAVLPGWKKILKPVGETKRGWRTILLHLVQSGYLSVPIAEQFFGVGYSANWASHTGKRNIQVPW